MRPLRTRGRESFRWLSQRLIFASPSAEFAPVMLRIAARGEEAAKPHGDGAGGHFREAGGDDDVGGSDGAGDAGCEREWSGESIRHADDDIAHGVARSEVFLDVWRKRHV
jgi:hypothetical protein